MHVIRAGVHRAAPLATKPPIYVPSRRRRHPFRTRSENTCTFERNSPWGSRWSGGGFHLSLMDYADLQHGRTCHLFHPPIFLYSYLGVECWEFSALRTELKASDQHRCYYYDMPYVMYSVTIKAPDAMLSGVLQWTRSLSCAFIVF